MLFQNFRSKIHGKLFLLLVPALAAGSFPWGGEAEALEFDSGEVEASLDTTVSYGATFRVADRDPELAADVNGNDGDLNYKTGIVSNAFKFTSEFDLGYGDFGLFVRGSGFFDFENESGTRERTPLSAKAKRMVGKDIELLDAYATGTFDLGEVTADLRAGKHVLNWGESTFIQGGVNAINPFDVSKLRVPGAELREALVAVPLVSTVLEFPVGLSMEGFYQLAWDKTEIDPVGSYFSVTDYVGPGASRAVVPVSDDITDVGFGFGPLTQVINMDLRGFRTLVPGRGLVSAPQPEQPAFDANFVNVFRGGDRNPSDSGQFGVALRYLAEQLNETEFGFYFVNYHSRLPTVSAITGTRTGVQAGLAAAQAVAGSPTSPSNTTRAVIAEVTRAVTAEVTAAVQAGRISPADAPTVIANKVGEQSEQISTRVSSIAGALAVDRYAKTASYFIEYPEDIQLFGLSFNTGLGTTGWALQGEYSFRKDQPLQRAERALFAEGLAPLLRLLPSDPPRPDYIPATGVPTYLAAYQPAKVQGYIKRNVSQTQATATRVFGPTLGADSLIFLTEVAVMHVHDMPKQADTPIESPAAGSDADATSWGYRIASRLDYNNAIGAVNLFPYLQFQHDVSGDSPSPSGSFVQGRTALTVGVRASYLTSWEANLGYTSFSGRRNELRDRDFVAATVKYSF